MLSTLISWAALLALGAGLTYYYNPHVLRRLQQIAPPNIEPKLPAKKTKRIHLNEKGTSTPTSSNEAPSKKRKIISAPISESVSVTTVKGGKTSIPRVKDEMDDNTFARELHQTQSGTKLQNSTATKQKNRTVKQGKAVESSADTSSANGDDMSPAGSPPSGPVSTAPTSRTGDVSDMLEAPTKQPTTLKITNTEEKSKPRQAKQVEQTLSKKQRQRQRANEEKNEARSEADRQQKQMMDKQMKGARMAEGSSKQTKSNAFIPTQSAWKQPDQTAPQPPPQLLDTFDPQEQSQGVTTQPLANITNGTNLPAAKEKNAQKVSALGASIRERPEMKRGDSWADEMINDEKQAQWEKELTSQEWEPVRSKKDKKKTKKDTDTSSETSSVPREVDDRRQQKKTQGQEKSRRNDQQNGTAVKENRFQGMGIDREV